MVQLGTNMGFQLASNVGFAMAFVSAFYILFYVKERESRAKLLQFVSGANVSTFWATAILWDFITFIVTIFLTIATLAIFQENGWSTFEELGRGFLMLLLFVYAVLPVTYIASMCFKSPSSAFTRMTMIYIFSGM